MLRFDRRRKFVAAAELDHAWIDHLNGIDAALQFFSHSDHALAIEASDRLSATIDDQAKSLKQRLLAVVEIMHDVRDRLPEGELMALSDTTFNSAAGSVSDIFAGLGASTAASMKAQGYRIQAQGDVLQAEGNLTEATNYDLASDLATKNAEYTALSTAIQEQQQQRSTTMQIGGQRAAIAGAGFAESGSSLDIHADSAREGALTQAVLNQQGLVTEAGYEEQATSYTNMAAAARTAAAGETQIAGETNQLASETQSAGTLSEIGDFAGALMKGAAAVASVALAPATGGLSLAGTAALLGMGGGAQTPNDI